MPEAKIPPYFIQNRPDLLDRLAGFIGRRGMLLQTGEAVSVPERIVSIYDLLDKYKSEDEKVVDIKTEEGVQLAAALGSAPQLEVQLFLPHGFRVGPPTHAVLETSGQSVALPVRNFVFASGFHDWKWGRRRVLDDTGTTSRQLIRRYARRPSSVTPIDGQIVANVQPNDLVFYEAVQNGGHRIAATQLRGDRMVMCRGGIALKRLPCNFIEW